MNPSPVFTYPLTILEHHLDVFGHMNNAVYLEIFEEARWDLVHSRGYGLEKVRETQQGPTILEIKISFQREIRLRQNITIHTQMLNYEGKVGELKQWVTNENSEVCCETLFKIAFFDMRLRRLIKPTAEWLHAIGAS